MESIKKKFVNAGGSKLKLFNARYISRNCITHVVYVMG